MKRPICIVFLCLPALLLLPAVCHADADVDFVSRLVSEYLQQDSCYSPDMFNGVSNHST